MRGSVGFLFPTNYGVAGYLPNANTTDPNRVLDIEETYFRGFTSGGPSTNRGYPIRGIAPYGYVPYLLPATYASQFTANCVQNGTTALSPTCTVPIAGLTLWELSIETRIQISGPFSTAVFCDAGDVSPNQTDIRPKYIHLSCGVGARYDTPVGPIRLDVGYRIQPLQILGYANETAAGTKEPENGLPPEFLGVPIAVSFGIGEAY